MGNTILGLVSGDTFTTNAFHNRNNRRRVFHDFPVGHFPLTGLLSLMDSEETDSFEFGWFEKRLKIPETTVGSTQVGAQTLPFGSSAGASLATTVSLAAGTVYTLLVASSAEFMVRNQIWLQNIPVNGGGTTQVHGVITEVGTNYIKFQCSTTTATLVNSTNLITGVTPGPVGAPVVLSGTAVQEGASAGTGRLFVPDNFKNYTQIFRTAFSFTRSSLKQPTEFDKTGLYRMTAEDNLRQHMVEMEMAFLFGQKRVDLVTENGETTPRRQTGGLIWFLEQWEKADSPYRGGTGAPAVTAVTDDNKRIIDSTAGAITWEDFSKYIERAFRCTNDVAFEKLCICGSGMLAAINTAMEKGIIAQRNMQSQTVYGINVHTWETPFGIVHFKTHPLFSRQSNLRNNGLIVDVQNLRFRPLNDSDTELLDNRQNRDYDGRKDEWLTEAGLEVRFPESHMYFRNVQSITPHA